MERLTGLPWQAPVWRELRALRGRGAHGLLLHGARGTGKKLLALEYATTLLCEAPRADGTACGACSGCKLTGVGNHPDLRVVVPDTLAALRPVGSVPDEDGDGLLEAGPDEPAGEARDKRISREITIDMVRGLADFLNIGTHRGGTRVVVLAPAEAVNAFAANALLKMLEEPPPASVFILATDAIDEVLPTIRSRCMLVRVPAPDERAAVAWLQAQGVTDAAALLVEAGGAPLLVLAEGRSQQLAPEERALLLGLVRQGAALQAAEVAARVPKLLPAGASIALFQRWAWDLLAYRYGGRVRYHPQEKESIARIAAAVGVDPLLGWSQSLLRHQASADHPLNARLVVESALLDYIGALRAGHTEH